MDIQGRIDYLAEALILAQENDDAKETTTIETFLGNLEKFQTLIPEIEAYNNTRCQMPKCYNDEPALYIDSYKYPHVFERLGKELGFTVEVIHRPTDGEILAETAGSEHFGLNFYGYVMKVILPPKKPSLVELATKIEKKEPLAPKPAPKAETPNKFANLKSEFVGQEKERLELEGIVTFQKFFQGSDFHGRPCEKSITKIESDNNVFVTFTSVGELDRGTKIKFKGSVKKHSEYQGEKQTTLIRVKVEQLAA